LRIAHISDTHLGYRQYNLDERENDIYEAFNQIVEKILEERVDIVIHSGDLFDSYRPPIKALKVFKEAVKKLSDKVKILTILGDHDIPKRRGLPPHNLFDEIIVLGLGKLDWIEINGILVAGISNLRGRGIELLKSELNKFDAIADRYRRSILIAHQGIDKYLSFEEAYELKEDDLPRKATYYAFGHIHSRVLTRFGGGYLAYAGSVEIMKRDEIESWNKNGKGFFIVDLEGDEPEIHKINVDIRPQYEIDIDLTKSRIEDILLKYINLNHRKSPIFHISISGGNINARQILQKLSSLLGTRALKYNVVFKDVTSSRHTISLESAEKGITNLRMLIGEYLKNYGIKDEKYVNLALDLYEYLAENEIEEARKIIKDFLESDDQ